MAVVANHATIAIPIQAADRDLARRPARPRSADAPGRLRSVSVPRQPLDVGVGHGVDLGTAGPGACFARACGGAGRSHVGNRRLAGAAPAVLSLVVTGSQDQVRVSVIIPTRNEALESIGRVLADLPADLVTRFLVVDSNSTDGTPEIAAKMGARRPPRTASRIRSRLSDRPRSRELLLTLSYSSTATTAIGRLSFHFCSHPSPTAAPTSRWVRDWRHRALPERCLGTPPSATVWPRA